MAKERLQPESEADKNERERKKREIVRAFNRHCLCCSSVDTASVAYGCVLIPLSAFLSLAHLLSLALFFSLSTLCTFPSLFCFFPVHRPLSCLCCYILSPFGQVKKEEMRKPRLERILHADGLLHCRFHSLLYTLCSYLAIRCSYLAIHPHSTALRRHRLIWNAAHCFPLLTLLSLGINRRSIKYTYLKPAVPS